MGLNLGRLAVTLARGKAGYNTGKIKREQIDFDQERELNRESLNESFRRDQLDERREQNEGMAQTRRDQMAQQMEIAAANRQAAAERQATDLATRKELADNNATLRRELGEAGRVGKENVARLTAAMWRRDRAFNDADRKAARTENRQAETDYNQMLTRRPRQSQFRDPLTGMADPEGFQDARAGFVADSTEKAGAREDARSHLSMIEGFDTNAPEDPRAAAVAELEQLKAELVEAIAAQPQQRNKFLREYAAEVDTINVRYGIRP